MSGEKGANLAPKEVCMGGPAKSECAEMAARGASQSERKNEVTIK